jgi:hypothetical protein
MARSNAGDDLAEHGRDPQPFGQFSGALGDAEHDDGRAGSGEVDPPPSLRSARSRAGGRSSAVAPSASPR